MTIITRRSVLAGLAALAAPAIIRTPGLLMPVKAIELLPLNCGPFETVYTLDLDGDIIEYVSVRSGHRTVLKRFIVDREIHWRPV